jgi:putative transposase
VIDDFSRAIAVLSRVRSSVFSSHLSCLAPGDLAQGTFTLAYLWDPEVLYTDNGSDFTSKHLEQVAVDLKIRLIFPRQASLRAGAESPILSLILLVANHLKLNS